MAGPGGARARSGPLADPNALSRNRATDAPWTHITNEPREAPAPPWPLTGGTNRELTMWAQEWRRPQAVMWEQAGLEREVALYVRALAVAEKPRARTDTRTLVRQYMDDLGISLPGQRRHRWIIDAPAASAAAGRSNDPDQESAKSRFRELGLSVEGRSVRIS